MSLINKMLRDLDARHAGTGPNVLPDEVRPLPAEEVAPRVSRRVWVLAGLAILSAAAIQTSAIWLPLLAEFVPLPPSLLPPPAVVAPAPQQAPTTVVLQLPPPEQMLPLPSLPDTPPAAPDASAAQPAAVAGQPAPTAVPAAQPAPVQVAESRSTDLKIDRSLPEVQVKAAPPAAAAVPAPLPAVAPAAATASKKAPPAPKPERGQATAKVEKQQNLTTPQERAEAIYRKGVAAYKVGHFAEAASLFRVALQEDPRHLTTRQTLLSMQAEQKQWDDVQAVLREGLELMPEQVSWAMALARIQVERGKLPEAWETLQKHMTHGEKSADYQGFAGVLLQRMQKPHEATLYYQAAVQLKPNDGRWWLGLGLALESDGKGAEAREAFQRARNSGGVTPEMAAAIDRKLR